MYALSRDGKLRWASEADSDFVCVSIGMDGTIYALANGGLFALAPDGAERWKFPLPAYRYFAGAVALGLDGSVYLTTKINADSDITVLTPHGDPKQRYRANSGSFVIGKTLITPDGTIYATKNVLNRTYAVALAPNGQEKWTGPQESETVTIAANGTIYIQEVSDFLATDSRAKILWKVRLPENPSETEAHEPTKAVTLAPDGRFYIGDFLGRLGTLDTSAGLASTGWPSRFHDARNTCRAGAR